MRLRYCNALHLQLGSRLGCSSCSFNFSFLFSFGCCSFGRRLWWRCSFTFSFGLGFRDCLCVRFRGGIRRRRKRIHPSLALRDYFALRQLFKRNSRSG